MKMVGDGGRSTNWRAGIVVHLSECKASVAGEAGGGKQSRAVHGRPPREALATTALMIRCTVRRQVFMSKFCTASSQNKRP
ncbi:unnamed protein product, partial [Iphiclides podalirius]